jgi:uncharacterized protein (DUF433 family)
MTRWGEVRRWRFLRDHEQRFPGGAAAGLKNPIVLDKLQEKITGGRRGMAMGIRHDKFSRIALNPDRFFRKPCIRGLRQPVASILSYLGSDMPVEEILLEWLELEGEDI